MSKSGRQWVRRMAGLAQMLGAIFLGVGLAIPVGAQSASPAARQTDFKQCANQDPALGDCHWINSILNANNSEYVEGMSVPQRLLLVDFDATGDNVHTLTLSHQATKGGIHAYDWLTSYYQAIAAGGFNDLNGQACDPEFEGGELQGICESLRPGANTALAVVPDDPFISKDGSTQDRINAYEATFGDRTIKLYGNLPITSASLFLDGHDVPDGGDTGDSYIYYSLTWTSESNQILIEMAGHLSKSGTEGDAWGDGLGAGNISGGPFHFKLDELDGASLGSQDNQIMAGAIEPLPTATPTEPPTATPTSTPPPTNTPTSTPTNTPSPTNTPTSTPTNTPTQAPPTATQPGPTATQPPSTSTATQAPPTATQPPPTATSTRPPPTQPPPTSVPPTTVPPTQPPVLIPVTGADLIGRSSATGRLFQTMGLAFLGVGLGLYGWSLHRRREDE